jgi:hypothetical protein
MRVAVKQLKHRLQEGDKDGPPIKAVRTAEKIYGGMSGLYRYYGPAKEILSKLGFLGKPADPLEEIENLLPDIKRNLDTIPVAIALAQGKTGVASKLTTLQLTDTQFASVKIAFDDAVRLIGAWDTLSINGQL